MRWVHLSVGASVWQLPHCTPLITSRTHDDAGLTHFLTVDTERQRLKIIGHHIISIILWQWFSCWREELSSYGSPEVQCQTFHAHQTKTSWGGRSKETLGLVQEPVVCKDLFSCGPYKWFKRTYATHLFYLEFYLRYEWNFRAVQTCQVMDRQPDSLHKKTNQLQKNSKSLNLNEFRVWIWYILQN